MENVVINVQSTTTFGSGESFEFVPTPIYPTRLVPEGGVCRAVPARQICVYCGQQSWVDETITCPGCQSQVFEGI